MKRNLIYSTGIALTGFLIFGCQKDMAESREPGSPGKASSPAAVVSREETYGCGDYIQGEPTYVQGIYNYPAITLDFPGSYLGFADVTISYNALTVQNRFRIVAPTGFVYFDSGWVSGTGSYHTCIESNTRLLVSAQSESLALDKWNVTISPCPYSCL